MSQQPIANVANKRIWSFLRSSGNLSQDELNAEFLKRTPSHELDAISAAVTKRERKAKAKGQRQ